MTSLLQDLRYGTRLLLRSPVFSVVAILTLAIGVGANTTIFSVINTLMLQRLPYPDADRLVIVWEHNTVRGNRSNVVGPANFLHWRDMSRSFDGLAAMSMVYSTTLSGSGEPEEVRARSISVELLDVLGVQPAIGRNFTADEERPGQPRRAHQRTTVAAPLQRRPGHPAPADRLAGRRLQRRRGDACRLHVSRQGRRRLGANRIHGAEPDASRPVALRRRAPEAGRHASSAAQRDMTDVSRRLTEMFPDFDTGWTSRVVPLREQLTGDIRTPLFVLAGAVAFVLLIACANVANLLLARATATPARARGSRGARRGAGAPRAAVARRKRAALGDRRCLRPRPRLVGAAGAARRRRGPPAHSSPRRGRHRRRRCCCSRSPRRSRAA